jgi:hypothetical protein
MAADGERLLEVLLGSGKIPGQRSEDAGAGIPSTNLRA